MVNKNYDDFFATFILCLHCVPTFYISLKSDIIDITPTRVFQVVDAGL